MKINKIQKKEKSLQNQKEQNEVLVSERGHVENKGLLLNALLIL